MTQEERTTGGGQSSMDFLDDLLTRKVDRGSSARNSELVEAHETESELKLQPKSRLVGETEKVSKRPKEKGGEKIVSEKSSRATLDLAATMQEINDLKETEMQRRQGMLYLAEAKKAMGKEDWPDYLQNLVKAAEYKNLSAMLAIGKHVAFGDFGVNPDPVEGERYILSAMELGGDDVKAQGKIFLGEIYEKYPKYFGMGKHLSSVLHIPAMIFGGLFAVIFISLIYLAIPIMLIIVRGNLWSWHVPMLATMVPGVIWLLIAVFLLFFRFKKICKNYYDFGKKIFESIVSNTYSGFSILIAIAFGIALCIGEYYLLTYLAAKAEFFVNHPILTKVCTVLVMVFSCPFVFYAGYIALDKILDSVKEGANDYY